jgi:hypothetical protein
MSNEIIFIVEDSSEGGYEAKALPHPIFTEGDTLDDCALWCAMPCSATLSYGDREEHVARHRWGRRLAGLVAFEFHAKTRQGAVVYRCRLNGPDEDWRTTRATRVEYEGLTAGDYTFEIVAVDSDWCALYSLPRQPWRSSTSRFRARCRSPASERDLRLLLPHLRTAARRLGGRGQRGSEPGRGDGAPVYPHVAMARYDDAIRAGLDFLIDNRCERRRLQTTLVSPTS